MHLKRLNCQRHRAGLCRSCGEITVDHGLQLAQKQALLAQALGEWPGAATAMALAPVASALGNFRNKAKMAVSGKPGRVCLGLNQLGQPGVDLIGCPLYPASLQGALDQLRRLTDALGIPPYSIEQRDGELKFLLLTQAWPDDALQLRIVLRSKRWLDRIVEALPSWQQVLPALQVVSVNLQPKPMAVFEGDEEILLTAQRWMCIPINRFRLQFGVRSFLQTNPAVAARLYAQVAGWVAELGPERVWDLYCGIGGFAFHAALSGASVLGIERSREAIEAANQSLRQGALEETSAASLGPLRFVSTDASSVLTLSERADLVIVNPPRRGLGPELGRFLNDSDCRWLIYSSCQLDSLRRDLACLPAFELRRWQLYDMFPHTPHFETLVLLGRR
jgi:23S rRNA (uracil747-C5)-methyltransferase